ncbi:SDR family oxidoreductase [Rhodohalobacter sp. 614A]|uniref:SDR family oxidoreductase n=1 Tax=Rhodohalobacter sp. 614A TaxID=2908649 RepID=UPI001F452725|nr:SDR family oxidoreductase [Rhodohalobacter sp. 614A]
MSQDIKKDFPKQQQTLPGKESEMIPEPEIIRDSYKGSAKLKGKIALITGGDSGIGRAVAVHYAREGARVAVIYLEEDEDAQKTQKMVEAEGGECLVIKGDIKKRQFCFDAVQKVIETFGDLNILVNNAGEQHVRQGMEELDLDLTEKTFQTNIISMFYLTKAAVKHLKAGDCVINTTSVVAFQGREYLIDYGATKGAILSFTRSLNDDLAPKGIRVNAVAPGPIWTPLIPASFDPEHVKNFGKSTHLGRPGQPSEVAPAYVFLASEDASYISGQTIHVNGGEPVGG